MFKSQKNIALTCVLFVGFLDWMGIGLVYPMFSSMLFTSNSMLLADGTSDTIKGMVLGLLLATHPIVQFFSSPIVGAISDVKGRKSVLMNALVLAIAGYLIAMVGIYLQSILVLLFSRVVIGISAGSASVVEAAVADLSKPEEKPRNFGLFNMATGLGFTIGPFLGGQLSEAGIWFAKGYDKPFLFAALASLVNLLMIYYLLKETAHVTSGHHKVSFTQGVKNIFKAFKLPSLKVIFISVFIFCSGWSFYWEFAPVNWIGQYEFSAQDVGTMYAYGAGFYALSCGLLIQPIVNRFRSIVVLFYSLVLSGVSILVLLFITSPRELWLYVPIQQYLISMIFPTATTLISNAVSEDMQGEMLGILQSVQSAAFAISPLISGPLLGITNKIPILVGGFGMLLAGIILGIFLRKEIFVRKRSVT